MLDDGVNPLVVLRYTVYELMVQFAGGVTAVQLRLMALEEAAIAVKPTGAEGTAVQEAPADVVALACAEAAEEPSASTASIL